MKNQTNLQKAHPNIAIVKYWGKKNNETNLPMNSSLSFCLPLLNTTTTVSFNFKKDCFILNGVESLGINTRIERLLNFFRKKTERQDYVTISSTNNFPTACGLASSASGIACLVKALNELYETKLELHELVKLAMIGSGSATRSIAGDIVVWKEDKIINIGDWYDIKIFNVVVDHAQKKISSTEGMILTKNTCPFFDKRVEMVDNKIEDAIKFIKNRDFKSLGLLTMKESNEIHSLCMSSYPPIFYLNQISFSIIDFVLELNKETFSCFYTFDAGPNPFIFVLKSDFERVFQAFKQKFNHEIILCR